MLYKKLLLIQRHKSFDVCWNSTSVHINFGKFPAQRHFVWVFSSMLRLFLACSLTLITQPECDLVMRKGWGSLSQYFIQAWYPVLLSPQSTLGFHLSWNVLSEYVCLHPCKSNVDCYTTNFQRNVLWSVAMSDYMKCNVSGQHSCFLPCSSTAWGGVGGVWWGHTSHQFFWRQNHWTGSPHRDVHERGQLCYVNQNEVNFVSLLWYVKMQSKFTSVEKCVDT